MMTLHQNAETYFKNLQNTIIHAFEDIERDHQNPNVTDLTAGTFQRKTWMRDPVATETETETDSETESTDDAQAQHRGGGTMAIMQGRIFEKVGVNFSSVEGRFSPEMQKNVRGAEKDPFFKATGISLVAHMYSPHIPAIHMNLRHIETTQDWFGGGIDMTPVFENDQDKADFHQKLQTICDRHDPSYYTSFKEWCDRYFFLPHRNEARGIGGIFFDHLGGENQAKNPESTQKKQDDFAFVKDVGNQFLSLILPLIQRDAHKTWTEDDRMQQLIKRGRYVEFNLLYDRGTQFGLKTGGNIEAILMSLPPLASWQPSL